MTRAEKFWLWVAWHLPRPLWHPPLTAGEG